MSQLPGVHGTINAMVEWDPDGAGPLPSVLVVGGNITAAGDVGVSGIATWDGTSWSRLGGFGPDATDVGLTGVLVHDGQLIASGSDLTDIQGAPLGSVVRWDGQQWNTLGDISGTCGAITTLGGAIVAGGYVTTSSEGQIGQVARWDGTAWTTLGRVTKGEYPGSPTIMMETGEGLVVGGWFDAVEGLTVPGLALWNGAGWEDIAPPVGDFCISATLYNNTLVVLMEEELPNYNFAFHALMRVNGQWQEMPTPLPGDYAMTVASVAGELLVTDRGQNGGTWGGPPLPGVARWNGTDWEPMGVDMNGAQTFVVFRGILIAGGGIERCDGSAAQGVAAWHGDHWSGIGEGISGFIWNLRAFRGEVFASGPIWSSEPGSTPPLKWNGVAWVQGLPPLAEAATFTDVYQDDLIIGTGSGLLRFDGALVAPMESPGSGYASPTVVDGTLYCFAAAPGIDYATAIFRLDPGGWTQLGDVFMGELYGLTMHQGELYAYGGGMTMGNGQTIWDVARWTGTEWVQVGTWPEVLRHATTTSVASLGSELIVGTDANTLGSKFAAWDGTAWHVLPPAPQFTPQAMITVGNEVLAAGIGRYIVAWNGESWRTIGTLDSEWSYVSCLMLDEGDVLAGGNFATIDGQVTNMIARLHFPPCCGSADFNGDGDPGTDQDITAFFACLAGTCCPTCGSVDFNSDGDVGTDQDIDAFFRVLSGGNC